MDLDGLDYDDMLMIVKILKRSRDKDYFSMLYALIHIKPLPLDAFMKKTV
uniref:Uncharacterized protein n=1 Tax=viral metagenome TaxID=1070528 RepID=A0A6C0HZP2_9ZZZZ